MVSYVTASAILWPSWVALVAILALVLLIRAVIRPKRALRLPPGPRPLPILGNALDLPRSNIAAEWVALSKNYGDIVYLDVPGQPVLTINSFNHALELLDKKSMNISHRPDSVMAKLFGMDEFFVFMPYGRKWREHRRAFHKTFGPESIRQWRSIQVKVARKLLYRLLESPKDFAAHLNTAITETVMRIVYGIELTGSEGHREYFGMVNRIVSMVEPLLAASAHPMEAFPFLRHLPTWLPGMGVKRDALEKRDEMDAITAKLYALSTTATTDGVIRDSMVTRIHAEVDEEHLHTPETKAMFQWSTSGSFIGGVETARILLRDSSMSNSIMEAFFLAMAMNPAAQKKAQEELHTVVGPDRLPEYSDLDSLPYLQAVMKELQRWHVPGPLGVAHVAGEDDEYMGYDIPAGTTIYANLWAMAHNPEEYPSPEAFIPERFVPKGDKPPARDPTEFVFGFGRRVCPGRYFLQEALFIFCATILHVLDIRPPVDERGVPVKLQYRASGGMVSHVHGYEYVIKSRGPRAERLVGEAAHSDV